MRSTREVPVCLLSAALPPSPRLRFWQAAPAARIRQPHSPVAGGGGTTRWALVRGPWVGWGAGDGGPELAEAYKYPPEPDDRTVSQLETGGRTPSGQCNKLLSCWCWCVHVCVHQPSTPSALHPHSSTPALWLLTRLFEDAGMKVNFSDAKCQISASNSLNCDANIKCSSRLVMLSAWLKTEDGLQWLRLNSDVFL